MEVERIEAPPHPDGSEGLLATVVRGAATSQGMQFVTDHDSSLQVGCAFYKSGHEVPPHTHYPKIRKIYFTQEVLMVRKGKILVSVYLTQGDRDGSCPKQIVLNEGDIIIFHGGGHGLVALEDSDVVEVKQGPYAGNRSLDKRDLFETGS
jgi:hypothetical protein